GRGTANALRKQAHEAPENHAFLPGWAQGQQSAASPVVVSSFLTDPIGTNGEPLNLEVGLEERAVQKRGDIASKQQVLPSRTDYNKLATLI
ncbi:hypothetical protein HN51_055663, partial [Arachis hypogaea]